MKLNINKQRIKLHFDVQMTVHRDKFLYEAYSESKYRFAVKKNQ